MSEAEGVQAYSQILSLFKSLIFYSIARNRVFRIHLLFFLICTKIVSSLLSFLGVSLNVAPKARVSLRIRPR